MATTKCDRKVKFKKAGLVSLYATASDKSKKTTKTVDTKTIYKATQLVPNKWYYISEFKKWVKMSLVENVNSTKKATTASTTTKAKFNGKNTAKISVYKKSSLTGATIDVKSYSTVKGKTYTVEKTEGKASYIKEFSGWVATSRISIVKQAEEKTTVKVIQEWKTKQEADAALQKLLASVVTNGNTGSSMVSASGSAALPITDPHGLYGIPYQFPDFVDRTIPGTVFGHYYSDRIVSRMPALILSPGKVTFMKNSSTDTREKMIDIIGNVLNGADTELQSFITSPGKYFSFDYDATTYWEYVNTMNRACAIFLGIGEVVVDINGYKSKLADFRWENATNKKFGSWLQSTESFVSFYADSESSTGEDFSNTTMESSIASSLNKSSDLGKEIRFLMGEHGVLTDLVSEETISRALQMIDGISSTLLNNDNNIISQLGKEFAVIATGGKLIFPEIWSDSSFSRDFDVKLKLRCPCPNKVSWFLDICSPINHLLAFTLPRTPYGSDIAGRIFASDVTPNGYFSPFLVRGMYKGISNVDMGIVTSLRIDKGKEGSWTIDGLPTEVDVSMTIKDLYNVMAMTPYNRKTDLLNNTQFLGHMAFNCGISINQPDILRTSLLWASIDINATYNSLRDTITGYNFWKKKKQQIQNLLTDMTAGFFS